MSYEEPYGEIEYKEMRDRAEKAEKELAATQAHFERMSLEKQEAVARVAELEAALKPFADFDVPKRIRDEERIYAQFPGHLFRTAEQLLGDQRVGVTVPVRDGPKNHPDLLISEKTEVREGG